MSATIPACGSYVGWTELMIGRFTAIQVEAAVPYDPQCANLAPASKVIEPRRDRSGPGQSTVPHAPIGPDRQPRGALALL